MTETLQRWLVRTTLCIAAFAAQAQGASSPSAASATTRPNPLDAKASVPALNYRSAFAGYRGFSDDKLLSWREANEAVARIGGWRAYAREAQQSETKPSNTPAPVAPEPGGGATPMPHGHSAHESP